jgi:hypothetical protein
MLSGALQFYQGMAALTACLGTEELIPDMLDRILDAADHDAVKVARLTLLRFRVTAKSSCGWA